MRNKRTLIWPASIIAGLFVLIVILLLLLPAWINMEWVKAKIEAEASQRTGMEVQFERVDMAFLPRPVVALHQCTMDLPGKITASFDSLRAHPEIGPLFHGELRLAELDIQKPQVRWSIPKIGQKERSGPAVPRDWVQTVGDALATLAGVMPDFPISIREGGLDVVEEGDRLILVEQVTATLQQDQVEVSAASNLCTRIYLKGSISSEGLGGGGRLELRGLQPAPLVNRLTAGTPFRLSETHADVTLTFRVAEGPDFHLQLEAEAESMELQNSGETFTIQEMGLEAGVAATRSDLSIVMKRLNVKQPSLEASGRAEYKGARPWVSAELRGRDVDVASLRQAVLTLAGDEPTVQDIFRVVRAGDVPRITLRAEGPRVADVTEFENLVIRGNITNGEIFIPEEYAGLEGTNFDLKEVRGEAEISKGVLKTKDARAQWENVEVKDGALIVGLVGDPQPYLEILAGLDLSDLPSLENRLIQSDVMARELAGTRDIRGSAEARFVLDDRTQPMRIQVDVSQLNMAAHHKLLPHVLKVSGGKVNYETNRIQVKDLHGSVGPSSFSDLSLAVELEGVPRLEVQSGNFQLSLTDLHPWVTSFEPLAKRIHEYVTECSGTISLSIHRLESPLDAMDFKNIDFDISGNMRDVTLTSPLLPAKVHVTEAKFEETADTFRLTDAQVEMLDASLMVSLTLPGYQEGIDNLDASFTGHVGEQVSTWASDVMGVPPALRIRPPLNVNQARIHWARGGNTRVSADVTVNRKPRVQVEGNFDADEMDIRQLNIVDTDSNMTLGFHLEEREIHLDVDGYMSSTTMDRLLVQNRVLAGIVEGDFEAHIYLEDPVKSTANGRLHGAGLGRNLGLRVPLTIEDVVLEAEGKTLEVESARVTWGDTHLDAKGHMAFCEKYFVIDMDVTGDRLHLRQLKEIAPGQGQGEKKEEKPARVPPVDGVIRVQLESLETELFEFSPVQAQVDLASDRLTIDVMEMQFCGTKGEGTLSVTPQGVSLDFNLTGEGPDVGPLIGCLTNERAVATGSYTFDAKVSGEGMPATLADSLRGTWNFEAREGRILKSNSLTRLLAYLHVIGILTGKYPGLGDEGFEYHSIRSQMDIEGSNLVVDEFHLDGETLDVAATGKVDVLEQTLHLTVLAAPFTTVEKIIGWIPGMRYIFGGGLIAIPVKVSGRVDDVKVTPLAPSAVGSRLLGVMERVVTSPFQIISPSSKKAE